jgi:hypothetical protein
MTMGHKDEPAMHDLADLKRRVQSTQQSFQEAAARRDRAGADLEELIETLERELDARCQDLMRNHTEYKRIAREYDQLRTRLDSLRFGTEQLEPADREAGVPAPTGPAIDTPRAGAPEAPAEESAEAEPGARAVRSPESEFAEEDDVKPEDVRSGLERMFGRRSRAKLTEVK